MLTLLLSLHAWALPAEPVLAAVDAHTELRAMRRNKNAPPIERSVYEKAANTGKIITGLVNVDGHAAKKAWGVGVVDVPIGAYWAAINDDEAKPKWTRLAYLEVLKGTSCEGTRRVFQFLPVSLVTDRWWVIDMHTNDALASRSGGKVRELVWESDGDFTVTTDSAKAWAEKGMHVTSTEGSWLLTAIDDSHTLVEYYTWADPGGAIPAGIASRLAAGGIDDTITVYVELAKKGPSCAIR